MQITVFIPDECWERKQSTPEGMVCCVFNFGRNGYCLCHEHYEVIHGTKESREAYYKKHPERRGLPEYGS